MTTVFVDSTQFDRLSLAVAAAGKNLRKEMAAAVNDAVKKGELKIANDIGDVLKMKKAKIKKSIKTPRRATEANPQGSVTLWWSDREGLEHFGARHIKDGVSYQIGIGNKGGRKKVSGAFMGPKPGTLAAKLHGGVYMRVGAKVKMTKGRRKGKMAQRIVRLFGVSPAGAYLKNNMGDTLPFYLTDYLKHQIERRINLNVLRANGLVSN